MESRVFRLAAARRPATARDNIYRRRQARLASPSRPPPPPRPINRPLPAQPLRPRTPPSVSAPSTLAGEIVKTYTGTADSSVGHLSASVVVCLEIECRGKDERQERRKWKTNICDRRQLFTCVRMVSVLMVPESPIPGTSSQYQWRRCIR